MKYVLFYESAGDRELALRHFPAHRAHFEACHAQGTLLMIGLFTNAGSDGAMAIFTTRQAAEEFAHGDPFVRHGVVRAWHIREWNEVLAAP